MPVACAAVALLVCFGAGASAQTPEDPVIIPYIDGGSVRPAETREEVSTSLHLFAILTVLSLAPAILIMTTSFTRIIVVFGLLRQALGLQNLPPNQIMVGLALFLTVLVMTPTWAAVHEAALKPYLDGQMSQVEACAEALPPVRAFMRRFTRAEDVFTLSRYASVSKPERWSEVPVRVLLPAFVLSELRTAFLMGFILFLPFLVIDLVVSSVLVSVGMLMLPPVLVSLPVKLMLFVLCDGWNLVVGSLLGSLMAVA